MTWKFECKSAGFRPLIAGLSALQPASGALRQIGTLPMLDTLANASSDSGNRPPSTARAALPPPGDQHLPGHRPESKPP